MRLSLKLGAQWLVLAVASAAASFALSFVIPGTNALVGPMIAATVMGISGSTIAVPKIITQFAQALTGCAIAATISVEGLSIAAHNWWQILLVVIMTLLCALTVGGLGMRFGTLPGTSAAWGSLPGGAPAMATLAEENGGNGVVVSIMQYLRVGIVIWSTSLIAHWLAGVTPADSGANSYIATAVAKRSFWSIELAGTAGVLVVAVLGIWLSARLRIVGGALLVPIFVGTAVNLSCPMIFNVPPVIAALSFAVIGCTIGLQFRRHLLHTLVANAPLILASILALVASCSLCAWLLAIMLPINAVTAFLATAPGGLDTIAAIALGMPSDMSIVTATHMLRLMIMIFVGPPAVRYMTTVLMRCSADRSNPDKTNDA